MYDWRFPLAAVQFLEQKLIITLLTAHLKVTTFGMTYADCEFSRIGLGIDIILFIVEHVFV